MDDDVIFSSPPQKVNGEWPVFVRIIVQNLQCEGRSRREIVVKTTLSWRTMRRILKQESSHRVRRRKAPKPHIMSANNIRQCIRHISQD